MIGHLLVIMVMRCALATGMAGRCVSVFCACHSPATSVASAQALSGGQLSTAMLQEEVCVFFNCCSVCVSNRMMDFDRQLHPGHRRQRLHPPSADMAKMLLAADISERTDQQQNNRFIVFRIGLYTFSIQGIGTNGRIRDSADIAKIAADFTHLRDHVSSRVTVRLPFKRRASSSTAASATQQTSPRCRWA